MITLNLDISKKEPISKEEYIGLEEIFNKYRDNVSLKGTDMKQIYGILGNYFFVDDERQFIVKEGWGNQNMALYKENSGILLNPKSGEKNRIPANSLLVIKPECNPLLDENGDIKLEYDGKCKCDAGYSGSWMQKKENLASASEGYTHKQNLRDIKISKRPKYLDYDNTSEENIIKTLKLPLFEDLEFRGNARWDRKAGLKFKCSGNPPYYREKAISSILQMSSFLAWLEEKLFTLNLDIYTKTGPSSAEEPYTIERLLNEDYGEGTPEQSYEIKRNSNFYNLLKNFQTQNHLKFRNKTFEEIEAEHQKTIGKSNAVAGAAGLAVGVLGLPFLSIPLAGGAVGAIAGVILGLPGTLSDFTKLDKSDSWIRKSAKAFKIRVETLKNIEIRTMGEPINIYELLRLTYYSVHKKTFRSLIKCSENNAQGYYKQSTPLHAAPNDDRPPPPRSGPRPEPTPLTTQATPVVLGEYGGGDMLNSSENPSEQSETASGGGKFKYPIKKRKSKKKKYKKKKSKMKRKKNKSKTKRRKRSKYY